MIYRSLDKEGDFTFGQGKQNFLNEEAAVAQAIKTRMKLLQGEWWENLEDGLPLFQKILARRQPKEVIDQIIKKRILGTPNVKSITEYESTWNNEERKYSFQGKVKTIFGDILVSEVMF